MAKPKIPYKVHFHDCSIWPTINVHVSKADSELRRKLELIEGVTTSFDLMTQGYIILNVNELYDIREVMVEVESVVSAHMLTVWKEDLKDVDLCLE